MSKDLLVEISEKRLRVRGFAGGEEFDDVPLVASRAVGNQRLIAAVGSAANDAMAPDIEIVNPFSHSRSMVGDFQVAEKLLQHAFRRLNANSFFRASPRVVMHQLEKVEGGLTDIEVKVLRELAVSAGAREVTIYVGQIIDPKIECYEKIKERESSA